MPAVMLAFSAVLSLAAAPEPARLGRHGLVAFGAGRTLYLSHIPMFHPPHDLQLVLEVQRPEASVRAHPSLRKHGHTFLPEPLDLTALAEGRLRTLTGTLFLGNFEAGGRELETHLTLTVKRVLWVHALHGQSRAGSTARYVAVGTPAQAYLVRQIEGAPGEDLLLAAHFTGLESLPAAGLEVDTVAADLGASGPQRVRAPHGRTLEVVVERTLSRLSGPDFSP